MCLRPNRKFRIVFPSSQLHTHIQTINSWHVSNRFEWMYRPHSALSCLVSPPAAQRVHFCCRLRQPHNRLSAALARGPTCTSSFGRLSRHFTIASALRPHSAPGAPWSEVLHPYIGQPYAVVDAARTGPFGPLLLGEQLAPRSQSLSQSEATASRTKSHNYLDKKEAPLCALNMRVCVWCICVHARMLMQKHKCAFENKQKTKLEKSPSSGVK